MFTIGKSKSLSRITGPTMVWFFLTFQPHLTHSPALSSPSKVLRQSIASCWHWRDLCPWHFQHQGVAWRPELSYEWKQARKPWGRKRPDSLFRFLISKLLSKGLLQVLSAVQGLLPHPRQAPLISGWNPPSQRPASLISGGSGLPPPPLSQ